MIDSYILIEKLLNRLAKLQNKVESSLSKQSSYRLICFFLFILTLILRYYLKIEGSIIPLFGLFFSQVFLYLVFKFLKISKFKLNLENVIDFYKRERVRSKGDVKTLFRIDPLLPEEILTNHYWKDLDIFGKKGLYSYLDTTITSAGNEKFVNELTQKDPPDIKKIKQRQENIKLLNSKPRSVRKTLRLLFDAAKSAGYTKINRGHFPEVGEIESFKLQIILSKVFVFVLWIGSFALFLFDKNSTIGTLLLISFLIYLIRVASKNLILKKFNNYFQKIIKLKMAAIYICNYELRDDSGELFNNTNPKEIKKLFNTLESITQKLTAREAPLSNFVLNLFFQIDVWILSSILNFSKKWEKDLEAILQKLEYMDSILPFANFYFHQKDTKFPIIDPSLKSIVGKEIGHPLISKKNRVNNPLEETDSASVILITGSNMSGKTTYLRSLGINTLLALCGSTVSAEEFSLPPLQILSSIKNEDSLDEGISFFYSEVRKIAYILKTAKNKEIPSLILIDEVLKGTNTRERIIATEKILKELSTYNSYNFITTHDLELAKGNKAKNWKKKHFVEQLEDGKMSFDYMIRDGIVNSSNALRILSLEYPEIVFVDD